MVIETCLGKWEDKLAKLSKHSIFEKSRCQTVILKRSFDNKMFLSICHRILKFRWLRMAYSFQKTTPPSPHKVLIWKSSKNYGSFFKENPEKKSRLCGRSYFKRLGIILWNYDFPWNYDFIKELYDYLPKRINLVPEQDGIPRTHWNCGCKLCHVAFY